MLIALFSVLVSLLMTTPLLAEPSSPYFPEIKTTQFGGEENRFLANITIHSPAELRQVLQQAERFFEKNNYHLGSPIRVVLHGPEAEVFIVDNYPQYKSLVKLAAQLQSLEVVDIYICETWMGDNGYVKDNLHNFVGTVPLGPAEIKRLLNLGYVYF